ncbi:hypothetical protein HK405_002370, partial [Cladochytrium tenue]
CRLVPKDEVHPDMFVGANSEFKPAPRRKLHVQALNKPKTPEQAQKNLLRRLGTESKKKRKLQELGVEYNFPSVLGPQS